MIFIMHEHEIIIIWDNMINKIMGLFEYLKE